MTRSHHSLRPRGAALGRLLVPLLLLSGSGAVLYGVWRTAQPPAEMVADDRAARAAAERAAALEAFYNQEAQPLLLRADAENRAAVQRAVTGVDTCFTRYAEGVDAFSRSLTGWGMRFKVLWRSGVETVERKDRHTWTAQLVQEKFATHVVSEPRLEADVLEVMKQFHYDLTASRNSLLAEVEARLAVARLPVDLQKEALAGLRGNFDLRVQQLLVNMPGQSVGIGLGSLTAGIVAQEAVQQLIRVVLAQAAARMATSAAATGGATVTAAAAGGTGGTMLAPGVGTAIGLAGGFIAGAAVDWWMTDQFEEKVSLQCRQFLKKTRDSLITGPQGLQAMLTQEATRTGEVVDRALSDTLRNSPPPSAPPIQLP